MAFSFNAGGFFAGTCAVAVLFLSAVLVLWITLAEHPFAQTGPAYLVGAAALAALAGWTLVSSAWSDAPGRALLEYDRVLLYLLTFVVFGALGSTVIDLRVLARGVAAGAAIVCGCALVTRVAPDLWAIRPGVENSRLSFPLTYWNALGLLAAVGLVISFSLTGDLAEARYGRMLAAAALPIFAATLLLTYSRGAIAASGVGLAAVLLVGRPRAAPSALLVAIPGVAISVLAAYRADLLATADPTTAAATAQGHRVGWVVVACVIGSAFARTAFLRLDVWLPSALGSWLPQRRKKRAAGAAAMVATLLAVALASGAPAAADRQYDRFVHGDVLTGSARGRLADSSSNGRLTQWRVGLDSFRAHPVVGQGAGTYALAWERHRPVAYQVEDAHSLYVEQLGELGLMGLLPVIVIIGLLLWGFGARARGPDRALYGGLFGAALAWALHAGIDWDWEMPAVTAWLFAAGGACVAGGRTSPRSMTRSTRLVAGLGCLAIALVPASVARSERALRASARAFQRGDCGRAVDRALASVGALASRPEPYAILGYCDVRLGAPRLAVRELSIAVRLDPDNWEFRYGRALVRGAAGLDPRPDAREALRLNPLSGLAFSGARRFAGTTSPRAWRNRALAAELPGESD